MKQFLRGLYILITMSIMTPFIIILTVYQLLRTVVASIVLKVPIGWAFGYYVAGMRYSWKNNVEFIKTGETKEFKTMVMEAVQEQDSRNQES